MKTIHKVMLSLAGLVGLAILVYVVFGKEPKNDEFKPQNEFKLDNWISIKIGGIDLSVNRAVLYLWLAAGATVFTMTYVARRMSTDKPNRIQTAVEAAYILMRDNITRGNMDSRMATRWFTFIGTLFLFIWFSNMIGYIPLPTNTHETINIFGAEIPSFAIYAATANIAIPLVLTLFVWVAYHVEGIRAQGFIPYLKSWIPAGTPAGPMKAGIFVIEVISQFVRLISLSVRLFANILAGHLLILFMAGGLVVILGAAWIGVLTLPIAIAFYIFEVGLVATLQAFIFATLASIYFGGATAAHH
jgi:F-type H+-transporting ATPase subunit a